MHVKLLVATMLALVSLPLSVLASDGNTLLAKCSDFIEVSENLGSTTSLEAKRHNAIHCIGQMQAITQTAILYEASGLMSEPIVCLPELGIKNGQTVRIVVKYLKANPENLHRAGTILAMYALMDAFPCKQASTSSR